MEHEARLIFIALENISLISLFQTCSSGDRGGARERTCSLSRHPGKMIVNVSQKPHTIKGKDCRLENRTSRSLMQKGQQI